MDVRLTKIIATLGPATGRKKNIRDLVKSGSMYFGSISPTAFLMILEICFVC